MNSEEGVEFYFPAQDVYEGGGVLLGEDEDDEDEATFVLDPPSQSSLANRKHAFQHFTEVTDDRASEVCRSKPNRKTRCAATHRRNERLRRQKFRERMDILRQLIPIGDKMTSMAQINSNPNGPAFPHPAVRGGVGNGMNMDSFHPMSSHFGLSDPSLLGSPAMAMPDGGPYMLESTELGTLPDVGGHGKEAGNHVLPML